MHHVKLDRDNPLDLHDQVAAEIRRAIADGEAKPGTGFRPRATSRPCSASTPTLSCAHSARCVTKVCSSSAAAAASPSPARPTRAVVEQASELVRLARQQGYRHDELIQIIEQLG